MSAYLFRQRLAERLAHYGETVRKYRVDEKVMLDRGRGEICRRRQLGRRLRTLECWVRVLEPRLFLREGGREAGCSVTERNGAPARHIGAKRA